MSARISARTVTEVIDDTKRFADAAECPIQVLHVCRQIYDEVFPLFYRHATLSIEKPLDFANTFLLRLDPAKVSQLRKIKFKVGTLTPPFRNAVDHLNSSKFDQILTIFKCYPELGNLDKVVLEILAESSAWFTRSQLDGTATEVSPEQLLLSSNQLFPRRNFEKTNALHKTILNLASDRLKGFKIFWNVGNVIPARGDDFRPLKRMYTITLRRAIRGSVEAPQ